MPDEAKDAEEEKAVEPTQPEDEATMSQQSASEATCPCPCEEEKANQDEESEKARHTEEFICDKCKPRRLFATSSSKWRHMRKIHGQQFVPREVAKGPFKCFNCPKTFTRKFDRQRHMDNLHRDIVRSHSKTSGKQRQEASCLCPCESPNPRGTGKNQEQANSRDHAQESTNARQPTPPMEDQPQESEGDKKQKEVRVKESHEPKNDQRREKMRDQDRQDRKKDHRRKDDQARDTRDRSKSHRRGEARAHESKDHKKERKRWDIRASDSQDFVKDQRPKGKRPQKPQVEPKTPRVETIDLTSHSCEYCPETFATLTDARRHFIRDHDKRYEWWLRYSYLHPRRVKRYGPLTDARMIRQQTPALFRLLEAVGGQLPHVYNVVEGTTLYKDVNHFISNEPFSNELQRILDEASEWNTRHVGFMCPLCWASMRTTYNEVIIHIGVHHGISEMQYQDYINKNSNIAIKIVLYESEDPISTTHKGDRVRVCMHAREEPVDQED